MAELGGAVGVEGEGEALAAVVELSVVAGLAPAFALASAVPLPSAVDGVASPEEAFSGFSALGDAYRSEYQPPPFRMKFVPALIRRCALDLAHLGHTSTGGSVIRWVCSHSFPHAEQAYS